MNDSRRHVLRSYSPKKGEYILMCNDEIAEEEIPLFFAVFDKFLPLKSTIESKRSIQITYGHAFGGEISLTQEEETLLPEDQSNLIIERNMDPLKRIQYNDQFEVINAAFLYIPLELGNIHLPHIARVNWESNIPIKYTADRLFVGKNDILTELNRSGLKLYAEFLRNEYLRDNQKPTI